MRSILGRALARNRRHLGLGTLLYCGHQLCESMVPILIGVGIDRAVAPGDGRALLAWAGALAVLFTMLTLAYRFGGRHLMRAITDEAYLLRDELAAKILHPRGLRTPLRAGELLTVASTDADNVSYFLDYVPRIAGAVTATLISAIALIAVDWRLGVAVLAGTPVVLGLLQLAGPRIARRVEAQQDLAGRASSLATDLVTGLRPLRGIGAEAAAARRYREVSRASLAASLRAARTRGTYLAASTATSGLLACGVAVLAGWFALTGRITVGELIAVIGLAQFLMEPLGMLAIVPSWIAEARGSAARVRLVLEAPEILPEPGRTRADTDELTLALSGVRHGTLDGLDLVIRPGEFVGVVACRPADADALAGLLAGRVAPSSFTGEVRLGEVPLPDLRFARELLHVEPHHTDLFAGSLADNLAPDGAEPAALAAALRASAADEVLAAHPAGIDHTVDERGAGLSGGQRQRIALARALLARPPILVLHDPTTAVDAVTEQSVALGVRALRKDLTTVVITSSPALLAVADRVVVLDEGRVRTTGTHTHLGATDPSYAKAVLR